MKKLQVIEGVVRNIVEVDADAIPDWASDWPDHDGHVGIGWVEVEGGYEPPGAGVAAAISGIQVNAERTRRVLAGTTISLDGGLDIPLRGDVTTTSNLQGLAFAAQLNIAAGDGATVTSFRDAENIIHELTQPQILELWAGAAAYVSEVFAASWVLKDDYDPIPADFASDIYWPD